MRSTRNARLKCLILLNQEKLKYIFAGTARQNLELSVSETEAGEGEDDISDLQADLSGHGHDHEMGIPDFKAQNFAQD